MKNISGSALLAQWLLLGFFSVGIAHTFAEEVSESAPEILSGLEMLLELQMDPVLESKALSMQHRIPGWLHEAGVRGFTIRQANQEIEILFQELDDLKKALFVLKRHLSAGPFRLQVPQLQSQKLQIRIPPQLRKKLQERLLQRSIAVLERRLERYSPPAASPTESQSVLGSFLQELKASPPSSLLFHVEKAGPGLIRLRIGDGELEDLAGLKKLLLQQGRLELRFVQEQDASRESLLARMQPPCQPTRTHLAHPVTQCADGALLVQGQALGVPSAPSHSPSRLYYSLEPQVVVHDRDVKHAEATEDFAGRWAVNFQLRPPAGKRFGQLTEANLGRELAIVYGGQVLSAPRIQSRIEQGGMISGNFTLQEAQELAACLDSGALPAPVVLLRESTFVEED